MTATRTIVVAVRNEAGGRIALRRAQQFTTSAQDKIHLIHVSRWGELQRVIERLDANWRQPESAPEPCGWLQSLAVLPGKDPPRVDIQVLEGSPGRAIADFAREVGADLVVLATPRKGQAREIFIGSTALHVLRSAPCPVIVTRRWRKTRYKHALVAVDVDDSGQRVAHAASQWFADAQIDLLHAFRLPDEHQLRMRGVSKEEVGKLRRLARDDLLVKLLAHRAEFPKLTVHCKHGFASDVIFKFILSRWPDILVLGKHRASSSPEWLMGSVTQFLIYASPTDLMLVP